METKIKAIIFDVGNVLVHWDPRRAYEPLFEGRNDDLDYFLNEVCTLEWHTKHDQGVPFSDNIGALQEKFPHYQDMIAVFEQEWDNMMGDIIHGTVGLLHQLHDLRYPLFALTNFPACKFAEFRQQHKFMSLFQDIVISGEEKITKPDPRIYQILLKRTGIAADRMLFIDDRMENLEAAQDCGLQIQHFTTAEQLEKDMRHRGILPR